MATAMPTRIIDDAAYYVTPRFECTYFDVSYSEPCETLNLFVSKQVRSWQERNFEDRVIGEIAAYNQTHRPIHSAIIYSLAPLNFTHLRKGRLVYDGKVAEEDFGPFYAHRYVITT